MSERSQVIMIWWSLGLMTIWGAAYYFLIGMWPPPPAGLSPQDVAALYAAHSTRILVGAVVGTATGAFLCPMVAAITYQIARLGKDYYAWAILNAGGGFTASILIALPSLFWGVAAFSPGRPPEVTELMHQLALLTLVTTDQVFWFQVLSVAYVCLTKKPDRHSPFPRWLGYVGLWEFLISELAIFGFLTKTGPFAWNGLFVFWGPLVGFGVWMSSLAYTMLVALKRQAGQEA